jgi:ureidoglycolate hydrolase
MKLKLQDLTAEAFSKFGQVCIAPPIDKPDHSCDEFDWWPDKMIFDGIKGEYGVGFARVKKTPFRQTCSERHMETPEFMLAVNGDMLVIVGPPDHPDEPDRLPELSKFAAFKVKENNAVMIKPGVWHYAAIPLKNEMYMYVVFAEGTSDTDCTLVDFPDGGFLEVVV